MRLSLSCSPLSHSSLEIHYQYLTAYAGSSLFSGFSVLFECVSEMTPLVSSLASENSKSLECCVRTSILVPELLSINLEVDWLFCQALASIESSPFLFPLTQRSAYQIALQVYLSPVSPALTSLMCLESSWPRLAPSPCPFLTALSRWLSPASFYPHFAL